MSVSKYHEFDHWFDCWEILPGQLGNKLLIQWWLASVAGTWKERERGCGRERNAKSEAKEGVISTFTWWMFIMQKPIVSWQAFPSLFSFPFEMPATQAKWSHSIFLPFYTGYVYQEICIFWWLEVKYILLDHWMYFWYWRTKAEKMVTGKGNIKSGTAKRRYKICIFSPTKPIRYKLVCEQNVFCYLDFRSYLKAIYSKSLPFALKRTLAFEIHWVMLSLLRCLSLPSPSSLLALTDFKSAFSLQRIFRCQIFPCEDLQPVVEFSVLVFALLFHMHQKSLEIHR